MSKKLKMFFFDIDGTIRSEEDGYIPESAIDAIRKLRSRGHKVFINTGRTASNVSEDIRAIGFDGYIFGCGTEVIVANRKIYKKGVDTELCRVLANAVCSCNAVPIYERSDALLIDSRIRTLPKMQMLLNQCAEGGATILDINKLDDASYDKFVIWYDDETNMSRFRRMIEGCFTYVNRGYGFAEMIPIGCSKAKGMKKVVHEFSGNIEDTVAFGDSLNDAEMLETAGMGIAMGGANSLYPYADYVTKELNKNGIAFALKQNDWI